MLCSSRPGRFMFRVGKEAAPAALARPGASQVVMGGRPTPGYIWVTEAEGGGDNLKHWVELALANVGRLPPKAK